MWRNIKSLRGAPTGVETAPVTPPVFPDSSAGVTSSPRQLHDLTVQLPGFNATWILCILALLLFFFVCSYRNTVPPWGESQWWFSLII